MKDKQAAVIENGLATMAGFVTVYNYESGTGEYIGRSEEYLALGVGISACSTVTATPEEKAGFAIVFKAGKWQYVEDHRTDTVYSTRNGEAEEVDYLGPVAKGFTSAKPRSQYDTWGGSGWITDTDKETSAAIAVNKAKKTALLATVNTETQIWQTQLSLGIITEDDKKTLAGWMRYAQAVSVIDANTQGQIVWPVPPA